MGTNIKKLRKEVSVLSEKVNNNYPQGNQETQAITTFSAKVYSGILPPAEELEKYEKIIPGVGQNLLSTYQKQVEHRIEIESIVIKGDNKRSWVGLFLGFIIVMSVIGIAYLLLSKGKSLEAFGTVILALGSLVSVFIRTLSERRKERALKK